MRWALSVAFVLSLAGCGPTPSPVADYLDEVEVQLFSDGKEAFVYLWPSAKTMPPGGCAVFGAPATVDGREMEAFQFGGEAKRWLDPEHSRYCEAGAYRVPFARGSESRTAKVRIADDTGEIAFTAVDTLTEPVLVWESASDLPPSGLAELRVEPSSLTFEKIRYADIVGLDPSSGRELRALVSTSRKQLRFNVPADAPPGTGQIRLQYEWEPQLSAPVLECKGATRCSARMRFSETARTPITVLPPITALPMPAR